MKGISRTIWVGACALLLGLTASMAKAASHSGPADRIQSAVNQLDLSTDQQNKVNAIISDLTTQVKAARKEGKQSGDMDTAKSKIKDATHDAVQKISDLLTDEQKTKFHEQLKESEAAHKEAKKSSTTQPAPPQS